MGQQEGQLAADPSVCRRALSHPSLLGTRPSSATLQPAPNAQQDTKAPQELRLAEEPLPSLLGHLGFGAALSSQPRDADGSDLQPPRAAPSPTSADTTHTPATKPPSSQPAQSPCPYPDQFGLL